MTLIGKQIHIHLTYRDWKLLGVNPIMEDKAGQRERVDLETSEPDTMGIMAAGHALDFASLHLNRDFMVGEAGVLTLVGECTDIDIPSCDTSFELDISKGTNQQQLTYFSDALEALKIVARLAEKPTEVSIDGADGGEIGNLFATFSLQLTSITRIAYDALITCVRLEPKPVFRISIP